jgi:importin-9
MALASIASWDWPEQWPSVVDDLKGCLRSPDANLVAGSMRCLSMFASSSNLTDRHLPRLVKTLFPAMLAVWEGESQFSRSVRASALTVVLSLVDYLLMLRGVYTRNVDEMLMSHLNPWMAHFVAVLARNDVGADVKDGSGCREKIVVLQILRSLLEGWTQPFARQVPALLKPVFGLIRQCAPLYERGVVDEDLIDSSVQDEDGSVFGFETLVFALLDVLLVILEVKAFRSALSAQTKHVAFFALAYLQITADEEDKWTDDIGEFAAEEETEAAMPQTVRQCAARLIMQLLAWAKRDGALATVAASLGDALGRQMSRCASERAAAGRWKLQEALVYALGLVAHEVGVANSATAGSRRVVDVQQFFRACLEPALASPSEFLRSRALWAAGRFGDQVEPRVAERFLRASVALLAKPSESAAVKVGACGALQSFFPRLDKAQLVPVLPTVVPQLCVLLASVRHEDVLHLLMSTLYLAVGVDDASAARMCGGVVKCVAALWSKHFNSPDLALDATHLFGRLAAVPGCLAEVHRQLLPTLASILRQPPDKVPTLSQVALDIVDAIMAPASEPLPEPVLNELLATILKLGARCTDSQIIQNVSTSLCSFVHAAPNQMAAHKYGDNSTPLQRVLGFLKRLLAADSGLGEVTALYVDGLVVQLLTSAARHLTPQIQSDIMRAVLARMFSARMPSLRQTMLFVFVRMLLSNAKAVLSFLAQIPTPSGVGAKTSGLEAVLRFWLKTHCDFLGHYRIKISCLAMISLFRLGDATLNRVTVPGKLIVDVNAKRRTRSSSSSADVGRFSQVPLPLKICELVVDEYASLRDLQECEGETDSDDDELDSGDELWCANIQGNSNNPSSPFADADQFQAMLSDTLRDYGGAFDDDDDDDEDTAARVDPLNKTELLPELARFISDVATKHPQRNAILEHLTPHQREQAKDAIQFCNRGHSSSSGSSSAR